MEPNLMGALFIVLGMFMWASFTVDDDRISIGIIVVGILIIGLL